MVSVVISQPMYLPWAVFLAHLSLADVVIWLDDAQFSKGSFTNRIQIQKPTGVGWLSILVVKSLGKQNIKDLEATQIDWLKAILKCLKHATLGLCITMKSPPYLAISKQTKHSAILLLLVLRAF